MNESRFLVFTLFLVVLVGAPAVYSVVKDPQAAVERYEEASSDRAPASETKAIVEAPAKTKGVTESVTLNLECNVSEKSVQGTHLRVTGDSCVKNTIKEVTVVNISNGFTASVIFTKGNAFTTDFIDLKDGENNLQISTVDSKGVKATRSLVVKRLPANF